MLTENLHKHFTILHNKLITSLPQVGAGIIVFALFWLTAIIIKGLIIRFATHTKSRKYLLNLLGQAIKVIIILIGLMTALGTMGINVTAMVTSMGLVGFALSFALKDFLSNIIAGFMILFYNPFKVGDIISVGDTNGQVKDINLRYTVVESDIQKYLIPNSNLITSTIKMSVNKDF